MPPAEDLRYHNLVPPGDFPDAMLDVHPPEHPAHTWRDFFIHIATIVVGLIIAVGLEQAVEYLHHRHQIKETREELHVEREKNIEIFSQMVSALHLEVAKERNNLIVLSYLKQHPGITEDKLPGVLWWGGLSPHFIGTKWQDAKHTGITDLMPQEEVRQDADRYDRQDEANSVINGFLQNNRQGRQYILSDPNITHLTPAFIEQEEQLMREDLSNCDRLAQLLFALQQELPDTKLKITAKDFDSYVRSPEDRKLLAHATAATDERLSHASNEYKTIQPKR
jgi:hypothetical protein